MTKTVVVLLSTLAFVGTASAAVEYYRLDDDEFLTQFSGKRDNVERKGGEGDFLYVPPNRPHAFRNDSDAPVRMLILFTPGIARENFFLEVGGTKGLSPEELEAFYARHDQYHL